MNCLKKKSLKITFHLNVHSSIVIYLCCTDCKRHATFRHVRDAEKTKDYRKWARVGHLNRLLQISKLGINVSAPSPSSHYIKKHYRKYT